MAGDKSKSRVKELLRSDRLASDFEATLGSLRVAYAAEVTDTARWLHTAERCVEKSLRRLRAGDVLSARRWIDHACDAEYAAVGECEQAGWIGEALGCDECPWSVVSDTSAEGQRRLGVLPTCEHPGCMLNLGDTVRAYRGSGIVVSPFRRSSDRRAPALVSWSQDGARPALVWRVDLTTIRCEFR
jgi:hypothetical protein